MFKRFFGSGQKETKSDFEIEEDDEGNFSIILEVKS